jgi:hypothetical protein
MQPGRRRRAGGCPPAASLPVLLPRGDGVALHARFSNYRPGDGVPLAEQ